VFGTPASLPNALVQRRLSFTPREYDVLPDGRLVGLLSGTGAEPSEHVTQIRVVVNWSEELKTKLTVK
jgi:hypothetical protein